MNRALMDIPLKRRAIGVVGAAILLAALLPGFARAQADDGQAREADIAAAAKTLNELSDELEAGVVDDAESFEVEVRAIIAASRERLGPVEDALRRVEDSLSLLGPAPKEGEPAEAAAIAAERADLNSRIALLRGQRTRLLANIDAGVALLGDLSERRLRDFYGDIAERGSPLVAPLLWRAVAGEARALSGATGRFFSAWGSGRDDLGVVLSLGALAAALVASILMFGPVRRFARRAITARIEKHEPTPSRRVAVAGVKVLSRLIAGAAGGILVIETARALGLIGAEGVPVARAIWASLIAFLLADGFTTGLFAPSAPAWRLAYIDATKARRASALIIAIVLVVGAKSVLVALAATAGDAENFAQVVRGVAAVAVAALLLTLCERRLWTAAPAPTEEETADTPATEEHAAKKNAWPALRFLGRTLAVLIIAAALAGHIRLADFAATRFYYLGLVFVVAWFLRAALKEAAAWADRRLRAGKEGVAEEDEGRAFRFWIGAGVDFILLLLLVPALAVLAGVEARTVADLAFRAFDGFRIGNVVISLSDIFIAILVFVGILAATRGLQGALERGPLAHSRVDSGIQNSLTTLLGYVGLVVAAIVGISMLGVDLSNLALIAGALSVGIGFGLQTVVNNFVSGLVLLFERPIKVGDWIVTQSGEGIVKKISVRSTELETFDRSSIIIPNSELVAQTVTNWTHKSNLGRIRVPVGVAYDSDPDEVREVLVECARAHPMVVRYPEPFAVLVGFGASALDFELRAFLSDISRGLQTPSELRLAILKAFRERGIEFPFPQQDIHVDWLPGDAAPKSRRVRARAPAVQAPAREQADVDAPDDE